MQALVITGPDQPIAANLVDHAWSSLAEAQADDVEGHKQLLATTQHAIAWGSTPPSVRR